MKRMNERVRIASIMLFLFVPVLLISCAFTVGEIVLGALRRRHG